MFTHLRLLSRYLKVSIFVEHMSSFSFIQRLNPINNKMEWDAVHDDYDYNQEIATSCYGDMLHDDERNKKFGEALQKAIKKVHNSGKKAHVLDIGTGTGLLSMLAVQYGADSVVACEAFLPMANCALNILKENNFSSKIKIVKCHSTSLTVGEKGDLKQKANILVSEVFDTELIGEGAIKTFNHAFEHLLEEDCIVIPSSATVYAQVVESNLAQKWNKLEDWNCTSGEMLIKIPEEIKNCHGAGAVHDIQLSEFDRKHFKVLSEVIPVFRFEWAKNKKIPTHRQKRSHTKCIFSGKAQAVFMWWDLRMDEDGEIIISCAPFWEHPYVKGKSLREDDKSLTKSLPWRDHWMQAVYFFTKEISLNENETFTLVSNHDEFSFWFEIDAPGKILEAERPVCTCAFHFLLSRTRIGALNDDMRRQKYFNALNTLVNKYTVCVVVGDISLLGVLCAKLGAKKVYVLSDSSSVEKVCTILGIENKVTDLVYVTSNVSEIIDKVCKEHAGDLLIVSEPYFRNSIVPWDNLAFWYVKEQIVKGIKNAKVKSIRTFPQKFKLKCCAIQFDNLWKIATPLNLCEGFSMKIFDDLIITAKEKAGDYVEAQPLWEYPGIALTQTSTVFEFDFNEEIPKDTVQRSGILEFECQGRCDGVALWMEYYLPDNEVLSFGPVKEVTVNEYISWDMFERQGVHLFRNQKMVNPGNAIYYKGDFDPQEAHFNFYFSFDKNENFNKQIVLMKGKLH